MAALELDKFADKWGNKYAYAIRSWRNNWEDLTSPDFVKDSP